MTTFLLIRHATNDMVGKSLAGWTPDVHLNDEGIHQAAALADYLAGVPLTGIYSSPLERAIETAEPLAQARGIDIRVLDDLGEINFGDWTGKTIKELSDTPTWGNIQRFPSGTRIPNGETLREMQYRVVGALERLRIEQPEAILAIVAHADIIKAVVAHYAGIHLDLFQRIVISPASVSTIMVNDHGPHVLGVNISATPPQFPEPKAETTPETERPVG